MKKQLLYRSAFSFLCLLCLLGKTPEAKAQAYDMIYRDSLTANTPPNITHRFAFYLYQNCQPAPINSSVFAVQYAINKGAPVIESMIMPIPILGIGNPFCTSQNPVCSASGPINFQKSGFDSYECITKLNFSGSGLHNIQTKILFAPGSFQAANIAGNFGIDPETFNAVTSGMTNVAPEFINPPIIFASLNQPISYSLAATDADGDSLVYRLRPVNNSATYASGFTYLNPITANPALALNSRTGVITFKPTAYDQTAGPGATANKYVIGIDVDEYRKLNGVTTKIGTIQRNVLVNVISNANQSPVLTASQNGTSIAPNTIIDVTPGTLLSLNFGASDPDITDVVYPLSNAKFIFPTATYAITLGSSSNVSQLTWTPTVADVRDEPYFFNVTATDDACPYPASVTNTYGIRVRVRNITGLKHNLASEVTFLAYPNPALGEVNFKIVSEKTVQKILIYNILGQEIDQISISAEANANQNIRWEKASKFAAGTYLAKLIGANNSVRTLKFEKLP